MASTLSVENIRLRFRLINAEKAILNPTYDALKALEDAGNAPFVTGEVQDWILKRVEKRFDPRGQPGAQEGPDASGATVTWPEPAFPSTYQYRVTKFAFLGRALVDTGELSQSFYVDQKKSVAFGLPDQFDFTIKSRMQNVAAALHLGGKEGSRYAPINPTTPPRPIFGLSVLEADKVRVLMTDIALAHLKYARIRLGQFSDF